jgi:hypothetical protein
MKNLFKTMMMTWLFSASLMYLNSCSKKSDPGPQLTGVSKQFALAPKSNSAISGTVTFAKRSDNTTLITVLLTGTQAGGSHPAHIHANTAVEGGGILLDFTPVNGATGKSETVTKALNDGTPISYEDLIAFNGYVNVHASSTDLGTLIAQGDIGQNELTGDRKVYTLNPVSNPAISGTATLEKRVNGQSLVSIALTGTTAGVTSPAHFHTNSAAQGGGIVINLTSVNGTTGKSQTNVSKFNSGAAITYDELLNYNGYLNVHQSETNLATLIAQGDIGQNELTGVNKVYALNPVSDPSISGTATFAARKSGFTLITLSLTGTTASGNHPAHIHMNNASAGGAIVIDLANVNGATGKSVKSVTQLNNGTAITYAQLIAFNGYVNVHLSASSLGTLIAQGNIGSNAP